MTHARLYRASAKRERELDGAFYAVVKTAGVFCRPGCGAGRWIALFTDESVVHAILAHLGLEVALIRSRAPHEVVFAGRSARIAAISRRFTHRSSAT